MKNILRLSRPFNLFLAALTYTLGASIPAYLGKPISALLYFLGLAMVLLAQVGMFLLSEVFRPHNEPLIEEETPAQKESLRSNMLYVSIAVLTAYGVLSYLLYINQAFTPSVFLFIVLCFLLALGYGIPPVRFVDRGFGELALALQIAYVIPSIGFILQMKENHRLLILVLLPLTVLALAYFLVLNFPSFSTDEKYQRATLLRRLTWERALPLHNSLIVFAYVLFASMPVLGYSFWLIWPVFLTLPFAILQMILLRQISLGVKPNWTLLASTAHAVFGLSVYFLLTSFWLH